MELFKFNNSLITLVFSMKLLFNGIQDCHRRILALITIQCPIQVHVGMLNTQEVRGFSILPISNLVALIPHYDLPIWVKAHQPLLRLDQTINPATLTLFNVGSAATTQKGRSPFHPTSLATRVDDDATDT